MRFIYLLIPVIFCSCANVSSTRLLFKSEQSTLMVEFPKELETKNLKVKYDSQQGTFEITSDAWISSNQGTLQAQSSREKAVLESSSVLIEKSVKGAVEGAMKGAIPIP
jgi:hypothetical protein